MTRQQPFRLLDLPPELRNNIYRRIFADSKTEITSGFNFNTFRTTHKTYAPYEGWEKVRRYTTHTTLPEHASILETNKQVRREALGIFVAETTWTVSTHYAAGRGTTELLRMAGKMDPKLCALVTKICCRKFGVPRGIMASEQKCRDICTTLHAQVARDLAGLRIGVPGKGLIAELEGGRWLYTEAQQ